MMTSNACAQFAHVYAGRGCQYFTYLREQRVSRRILDPKPAGGFIEPFESRQKGQKFLGEKDCGVGRCCHIFNSRDTPMTNSASGQLIDSFKRATAVDRNNDTMAMKHFDEEARFAS